MLPGQKYKEFLQQQGEIEKNIAEGWGYEVNNSQYITENEKIRSDLKVANIVPLKHVFNLPASKKLQQVQKQLQMLQNQRKLNELTEKALQLNKKGQKDTQDQCPAIKMMRQCIQQYNFIIDHRHIAEKNTDKARKILGIQKSQSKELFEQINTLKEKIGESTLAKTIKVNTQIAKLYKKYSCIVPKSTNRSERVTTEHNSKSAVNQAFTSVNNSVSYIGTSKLSPNKRTGKKQSSSISEARDELSKKQTQIGLNDLMIMQQLNESEEGDSMLASSRFKQEDLIFQQPQSLLINHSFLKMQRRISQYGPPRRRMVTVVQSKGEERNEKKQKMNTTVQQVYVTKQIIQKGKKLDKIMQQHHDVIDVWRQRINQNSEKNRKFQERFKPKVRAKRFKSLRETKQPAAQIATKKEEEKRYIPKYYKAEEMQKSLIEKQKILSQILRKKQSKFKRVPGTQLMQKNDVQSTAKSFLGIQKKQNRVPQKKEKNIQNLPSRINPDCPEWEKLEMNDEKLYWSMCKNEKMNILLKNHTKE